MPAIHSQLGAALCLLLAARAVAARGDDGQAAFFETKIRPVLVQHCQSCHNSHGKQKGGLALDWREPLRAGGDSGPAVVPGNPEESVLVWALAHDNGYEMPANAPQLPEQVARDFADWVRRGAFDPRDAPPIPHAANAEPDWATVRDERAAWWAFQPAVDHPPPEVADPAWRASDLDRFVRDLLAREGIAPEPEADPATLVRRLHLVLTGLPPAADVVEAFVADPSPAAYESLVEQLLASPRFGERWARHWMDWFRYAETHGSEGDAGIPYAAEYRDYLVRALNADVPADRLLVEHLAGDLLADPRINVELAINESAIGPAHLRMVPHGFGVTDAYAEQVTFIDNQIDVVSKAMLGLTVSCARCHHHKFDPVSQHDFHRLFGIFAGTRASTVLIDSPEKLATGSSDIEMLKPRIRQGLAEYWLAELERLGPRLDAVDPKSLAGHHPLAAWAELKQAAAGQYHEIIARRLAERLRRLERNARLKQEAVWYLDLRDPATATRWHATGNGTAAAVSPAGSFALRGDGDEAVAGIYPRGVFSHLLSDRHAAVLATGFLPVQGKVSQARLAGRSGQARAPVRGYPLAHGLHPAAGLNARSLTWQGIQGKWNYWLGERVHYELRTSRDTIPSPGGADRSWFGVAELYAGDEPLVEEGHALLAVLDDPAAIGDRAAFDRALVVGLRRILARWQAGTLTDTEAEALDGCLQAGLLPNAIAGMPGPLRDLLDRYRSIEHAIPVPRRAPGVIDAEPLDQPLLVRGDHRSEAEAVPRGFLEVLGGRSYPADRVGRLELAADIVSPANPLTTRVFVNRLWAQVFGRGIVASVDNFGRLGDEPTHPELLDHLANSFRADGWSIKRALERMVTSRSFRGASTADPATVERDPDNELLARYAARRLDAEAIHDSLGFLAGRQPRAVFLPVRRNALEPFLTTFNAPVPTTTVGQRTHTNVPAQALTMLNGDLARGAAEAWAARVAGDGRLKTDSERIDSLVFAAYARPARPEERELLLALLGAGRSLADVAHVIVNTKEFIHVP